MGEIEQNIIKQAIRFGHEIPERIQNAPELRDGLDLYYTAFFDLTSDRSVGMSLGPIPWSSMLRYALHYEFDEEQQENLFFFLPKMDAAYLKKMTKASKGK